MKRRRSPRRGAALAFCGYQPSSSTLVCRNSSENWRDGRGCQGGALSRRPDDPWSGGLLAVVELVAVLLVRARMLLRMLLAVVPGMRTLLRMMLSGSIRGGNGDVGSQERRDQ